MEPEPEPEPSSSSSRPLARQRQRLLDDLGRWTTHDASFAEFLMTVGNSDLGPDDPHDIKVPVIDAGRLRWKWGLAGEDSPESNICDDHTLQGQAAREDGNTVGIELERLRNSRGGDCAAASSLLRSQRAKCCGKFLEWVAKEQAARTSAWAQLVAQPDGPRRAPPQWPPLVVVTVPLLERADDPHPLWLLSRLFHDLPALRGVALQNQETLATYASGRTSGLVLNLGYEVSMQGIYEGVQLPETARVITLPRHDLWPLDSVEAATEWLDASGVLVALKESLAAAPIDTRAVLTSNIVLAGGNMRSDAGRHVGEAIRHASSLKWTVVTPPERAISAWIGGSVFGSLSSTFRGSYFVTRARFELCEALLAAPSRPGVTEAVDRLLGSDSPLCQPSLHDRAFPARQILAWACCLLPGNVPMLEDLPEEIVSLIAGHLPRRRATTGAAAPEEVRTRTAAEEALLYAERPEEQGAECVGSPSQPMFERPALGRLKVMHTDDDMVDHKWI